MTGPGVWWLGTMMVNFTRRDVLITDKLRVREEGGLRTYNDKIHYIIVNL